MTRSKNLIAGLYPGMQSGFITALTVTIFDFIAVYFARVEITFGFLASVLLFNISVWVVFGVISQLFFVFSRRDPEMSSRMDRLHGLVFFVAPFAVFYGFLSKLTLSTSIELSVFQASFLHSVDDTLSFVWVACFLLTAFYVASKNRTLHANRFRCLPEIASICFIFMITSNQDVLLSVSARLNQSATLVYIGLLLIVVVVYAAWYAYLQNVIRSQFVRNVVLLLVFCATVALPLKNVERNSFDTKRLDHSSERFDSSRVPYVILIVMDTARADRLAVYADTDVGAYLKDFASESLVFERCYAPSSWTLPSHASLFTGRYPTGHGADANLDGTPLFDSWYPPNPLPDSLITMAEIFQEAGYQTLAVSSNYAALTTQSNIYKDFDYYENRPGIGKIYTSTRGSKPILPLFCWLTNISISYAKHYITAKDLNERILSLLDMTQTKPFFLFINYMAAHDPYRSPFLENQSFFSAIKLQTQRLSNCISRLFATGLSDSWYDFLLSSYDAELVYLDTELRNFFSSLKKRGIYDESLIIITSDHGEMFNEKGCNGHRTPLYQEVLHVPLMIKFPQQKRVGLHSEIMTFPDLFATILTECDLPLPEGQQGVPYGGQDTLIAEFYSYSMGRHQALFHNNAKLMVYGDTRGEHYSVSLYGDRHLPELYDLQSDPLELTNIIDKDPALAHKMRELLSQWNTEHTPAYVHKTETDQISQDIIQGFRALGYIQ